jgi:predicted nucleotidyltransferase
MAMRRVEAPVKNQVRRIVKRIVSQFDPDRIILFGSHARGDAGPHSDVDLLVVMPVEGSKREQQLRIRMALRRATAPVHVVVTRPEDFEWRKKHPGTIERPAYLEGNVLYERGG